MRYRYLTGVDSFDVLCCPRVALCPHPLGGYPSSQKYIALDPTKPMQLSVKQDGTVDLFEMQASWERIIGSMPLCEGISLSRHSGRIETVHIPESQDE